MSAAYVSYSPDLAAPGAPQQIAAFAAEAVGAGTRRLVLISGRGEPAAQAAERALQASGAEWTVVRCSFFAQNFSEAQFHDALLQGELALPVDGVCEPFVDADDIADVAVAALAEDGHEGEVYELTGPRPLTFAEAVAEIAAATGRPLRYVQIALDDFTAQMASLGTPAEEIDVLRLVFGEVLDGRNAHVTDGVKRALGREPRDFAQYVRDAAATGAWIPQS